MKKLAAFLSTLLILFGIAVFFLYQEIDHFGIENTYSSSKPEILKIQLRKGDSATSLLSKLEQAEIFSELLLGKLWLKLHPEYNLVKKGYYEFPPGASVDDIFQAVSQGKVKQFSITLVEGLTLKQWLHTLQNTDAIIYDITSADRLYDEISSDHDGFCNNEYKSLEGCLLANTYFFDYQTKASEIVKRAYRNMDNVIHEAWHERHLDTVYRSPYEMLIMASIIEKETAVESERGLISGVFDNRLKRNMRLQTDPTVIYGVGAAFDGNLTRKHLRERTPYNTYVIKGLPITPIAMAGPASIEAAAKPEITEAIYFVAKGDGSHQFSETLAEHNAAVRQYQLKKGK
jgi:UPF0755 protein